MVKNKNYNYLIIIIIILVDVHFIPFSKKYNWNDAYDIYLFVDYIDKKWSWQLN